LKIKISDFNNATIYNKVSKVPKSRIGLFHLDTMSCCDSVLPIDQYSSTFALPDPDEGLPRKAAESRWLAILRAIR
jgi:hypothetical protein